MAFYSIHGNDAANVLAEAVSTNIADFVKLMNKKSKEIGCANTNFTNAHGYHDSNHYSTARDMTKLLNYCIKNDTFVQISSTKKYTIPATNKTTWARQLQNSNRLMSTKKESVYGRYYKYCVCGKTGYTEEAGRCLVSYGIKDNKHVLIGVFNSKEDANKEDAKFTDTINLFEYSFNNFEKLKIIDKDLYTFDYLNEKNHVIYTLGIKNNISALMNSGINEIKEITYNVDIDHLNLNFKEKNADYLNPYGKITFTITTALDKQEFIVDLFVTKASNLFYIQPTTIVVTMFSFILLVLIIVIISYIKFNKSYKNKTKLALNKRTSRRKYLIKK